jgi:hypothetical protein
MTSQGGRHSQIPSERGLIERWLSVARQAYCEYGALARLACYCDVAAHHARKLARDRQSEASVAEALCGGALGHFAAKKISGASAPSLLTIHPFSDNA